MPMALSSRAGPPSADTLSRRPSKRSYVDMDNDDSDTSEYVPNRKGKKRASTVNDEGPGPLNTAPRSVLTGPTGGHSSSADKRQRNIPGSFRGRAETALHAVLNRKGSSDRVVAKAAPPEATPKRPVVTTKARLDAALAEIVLLRDQLAVADQTGQQNVMKARQDEVFHVEVVTTRLAILEERHRKVVSQFNSAQRRAVESDLALTAKEARTKALDARIVILDQQGKKLKLERDACAGEAEHYQTLLTIAEEETQELRRIETEDRAQRARDAEKRTLPPAYGSLPNDEPVAATEESKDSGGHFEVANFKHMIRSTFMVALTRAQSTLEATNGLPNRTAVLESRTDARFVLALVSALADASRNIDDVLVRAGDFWACSMYHSDMKSPSYQVRREAARHEYVADRFAKTIIDLVLRTLAALELRPLHPSLRPYEASAVALAWSTVDECLLKTLRSLFNGGTYHSDMLYLTGTTRILTGADANAFLPRSNLCVHLTITSARFVASALPFRGVVGESSPYNPSVRYLASEHKYVSRAETQQQQQQQATLLSQTKLAPTISRFRFHLENATAHKAGQYVTLDFSKSLDVGYSHMRDDDPRSLNDDFVRTFTVSSPPANPAGPGVGRWKSDEFEVTVRNVGVVTGLLFKHEGTAGRQGSELEIGVKGFEGEFEVKHTGDKDLVVFVAAGVGITPLLPALGSIDLTRLELIWTVRTEDLGLVMDTLATYPKLAASLTLFVTGSSGEGRDEEIRRTGVRFHTRRLRKDDLRDDGSISTYYVCTSVPMRKQVEQWLPGRALVFEDFNF
ncbi:hypothetical protein LTR12_012567 [Friedmanniomyces endolithicus]|nr:hypothetical protein LTR12_012567 [Friedmanniomyces endolithicus]